MLINIVTKEFVWIAVCLCRCNYCKRRNSTSETRFRYFFFHLNQKNALTVFALHFRKTQSIFCNSAASNYSSSGIRNFKQLPLSCFVVCDRICAILCVAVLSKLVFSLKFASNAINAEKEIRNICNGNVPAHKKVSTGKRKKLQHLES